MNPLTHGTMPAGWVKPDSSEDLSNEQIIWRHELTEGIWNKKTVQGQLITNKRIVLNDNAMIFLKDLSSATALNSHRETKGQGARLYARQTGVSYGNTKYSGSTFGDVVFMDNNGQQITFNNVPDPAGVVRLVKATSKSIIENLKVTYRAPKPISEVVDTNVIIEGRSQESGSYGSQEEEWFDCSPEKIKFANENMIKDGTYNDNSPRCPKDGFMSPNSLQFCTICGTKLVVPRMGEATSPTIQKMMDEHPDRASYCPNDGTIHVAGWMRFCGACGGTLIPVPKESASGCGKCGKINSRGSKFCNDCGYILR